MFIFFLDISYEVHISYMLGSESIGFHMLLFFIM